MKLYSNTTEKVVDQDTFQLCWWEHQTGDNQVGDPSRSFMLLDGILRLLVRKVGALASVQPKGFSNGHEDVMSHTEGNCAPR